MRRGRRSHIIIVGVFALLIAAAGSAVVHADEGTSKEGELWLTRFYRAPMHSFKLVRFGGSIRFSNYTYPYSLSGTDIRTSNRLIFKAHLDVRAHEHVRLYGEMKLRTDLPQSTIRTRVIPQEAFIDVNVDRFNVRGGYQIFSWGVADIYEPLDVLNPRDYTDIFDFEKEGIPALTLTYAGDNFSLEGIWMPIPEESMLPYRDSRFVLPFLVSVNNPLFPVIGLPPANYDVTENYLNPATTLKNSQFAARVLGTVGRFDLGLSYFNGFEKVPHQEVILGIPDPATGITPGTVNQVYLRDHVVGATVVTGFKGLNLQGEGILVVPYHTTHDVGGADEPHVTYVLGADYTFFDVLAQGDFAISLEFVHQINLKDPAREDFADLFQKTLFGRLEYRIADYLRLRFTGVYNFDNTSYYLNPEIMWEPIDDLELTLGGDVLDGPSDTLFGLFDRQDRLYAIAKFYF